MVEEEELAHGMCITPHMVRASHVLARELRRPQDDGLGLQMGLSAPSCHATPFLRPCRDIIKTSYNRI